MVSVLQQNVWLHFLSKKVLVRDKEPTPDLLQCSPTDNAGHKGQLVLGFTSPTYKCNTCLIQMSTLLNIWEPSQIARPIGSEETCSFALRSRVLLYSFTNKWPRKKWLQRKNHSKAGKQPCAAFQVQVLSYLETAAEWQQKVRFPEMQGHLEEKPERCCA